MADELGPQRRVTLEVELRAGESPESTRHAWVFPGESLTVGRTADFSVDTDLAMSRRHFQISFDGRTCQLRDLQSSNGTQVNGQRVTATELRDGDRIQAGRTGLLVRLDVPETGDEPRVVPPHSVPFAMSGVGDAPDAGDASDVDDELDDASLQPHLPRTVMLQLVTDSSEVAGAGMLSRFMAWVRSGQSIVVGNSGFDADWRIPNDPLMAARHFRITFDGTACLLNNLDVRSGTLVNDDSVDECYLADGDRISAGKSQFLVRFS